MKPRDQGGVVDSRLNVYGVQHLKVADMSICPANVATVRSSTFSCTLGTQGVALGYQNTYSTAVMIGEKAAALIAEDLGLAEI